MVVVGGREYVSPGAKMPGAARLSELHGSVKGVVVLLAN